MNQENNEIVKQLKSIKIWVAIGAIGFLLIGIGVVIVSASVIQMTSVYEEEYSEEGCGEEDSELLWEDATELLQQGKTEELLEMANKRLITHPNDPTAHWFKAKVNYLNKEWKLALDGIEKTEMLAPNWRQEYTQPLKEKIYELSQ